MGRLHLFEIGDQAWAPEWVRRAITEYLDTISRYSRVHRALTPLYAEVLRRTGHDTIIDLCSGSGGPIVQIQKLLRPRPKVLLTDKYPDPRWSDATFGNDVQVCRESVDATEVPSQFRGARSIVNAFHHFKPSFARSILQSAAAEDVPLIMIELAQRRTAQVLASPLIVPMVFAMMPFVQPTRLTSLVFTYLVPVLPLIIFWDGLVSNLRAYSKDELLAMTGDIDAPGYSWEFRDIRLAPGAHASALIGWPETTTSPT